jgi:hypothetical protein
VNKKITKYKIHNIKMPYFYILQTRAIINAKQNIFKIGKTANFEKRLQNYDKGSEPLFLLCVKNHDNFEQQIKHILKEKFIQRKDYGEEYFEGNFKEILNVVNTYYFENEEDLEISNMTQQPNLNKYSATDVMRESNKIRKKLNRYNASKMREIYDFQSYLSNRTTSPYQEYLHNELNRFVQDTYAQKSCEKLGDHLMDVDCIKGIVEDALLQHNEESNKLMKLIRDI